jgi:ubiquinone/menaquinone biosynthesis C-methylase UbiE
MAHSVCPWWIGYLLASPLRKWFGQDPIKILSPYVREGMTVLEPGPGMGFFTLPLAQLVGRSGRVIAVDLQPKMIAGLKRRAAKANLLDRIDARLTSAETMALIDVEGQVDFTLAFAMVHEFPDAAKFFAEVARVSKPNAQLLLAEPAGHVKEKAFAAELSAAEASGLSLEQRPSIPRSHAALLVKPRTTP